MTEGREATGRRQWGEAESLDAAAAALALCATGWLDEQAASRVVALHCCLHGGDGTQARVLANSLIVALDGLPPALVPGACTRWLDRGKPV